ncbi:hypothetical protein M0811_11996 [Anaeramoeba ignava]|uniref:Uncharacterized protein n=1 Tax=Anaeramoeba ignava TaxID=1746090 RepID=A0A9Q0LD58_ANAIG|nr:hypothetical protein M0811_11996 [Anaeramoeba ignava]
MNGSNWIQQEILTASDGNAGDFWTFWFKFLLISQLLLGMMKQFYFSSDGQIVTILVKSVNLYIFILYCLVLLMQM